MCWKLVDMECLLSFFIGGSCHQSTWFKDQFLPFTAKQQTPEDTGSDAKISLYNTIAGLLQLNLSQEVDLRKFLELTRDIKNGSPPPELTRIAILTTSAEPADRQDLKLLSNLVLVALYCRTTIICANFAGIEMVASTEGFWDVLHELNRSSPRYQVIKYAGAVLDAFEILSSTDPHGTANNWFRLVGAIIAAILISIASLRDQKTDRERFRMQLNKTRACFESLWTWNAHNPILQSAIAILQECATDPITHANDWGTPIGTNLGPKRQPHEPTVEQGVKELQEKPESRRSSVSSAILEGSEIEEGIDYGKKRRKMTNPGGSVPDRIVQPKEDASIDHTTRSIISHGDTAEARPFAPQQINGANIAMSDSFDSANSAVVAQGLVADYSYGEDEYPSSIFSMIANGVLHPPMNLESQPIENYIWGAPEGYASNPIDNIEASSGETTFIGPSRTARYPMPNLCATAPPAEELSPRSFVGMNTGFAVEPGLVPAPQVCEEVAVFGITAEGFEAHQTDGAGTNGAMLVQATEQAIPVPLTPIKTHTVWTGSEYVQGSPSSYQIRRYSAPSDTAISYTHESVVWPGRFYQDQSRSDCGGCQQHQYQGGLMMAEPQPYDGVHIGSMGTANRWMLG